MKTKLLPAVLTLAIALCNVDAIAQQQGYHENTWYGLGALVSNTEGEYNSAFGYEALTLND
jgi:hypothetical protein